MTERLPARVFGPAVIAATGAIMLAWTWRTWPDPLVDFGRELYVPWQLAEGRVLYTDIAHFTGPLSPYWNALWFRLLGPSLSALVAVNVVLLAGLTALLYALLVHVAGRFAGTVGALVFVTLFAFSPFGIGNYNYVCPYSHELTHGILLTLAGLCAIGRHHRRGGAGGIAGAGLALGLLALTKIEVLAAGGAAILLGVALTLWVERPLAPHLARLLAAFTAAALVPILVTVAGFSMAMPLEQAIAEPLGYWRWALRDDVRGMAFFRAGMGLDDARASLVALLTATAAYGVVLGPAALASLAAGRAGRARPAVAAAVFGLTLAALLANWSAIDWLGLLRPLPLAMLAVGAGALVRLRALRRDLRTASPAILAVCLTLFALGMLSKMVLNVRIYHYGFALAMPATILLVVALVGWAPAALDRAGGDGATFRAAAVAAIMVALFAHLALAGVLLEQKQHPVGSGPDWFLAGERGPVVDRAVRALAAGVPPGGTLLAVPEGVMLNYLLRRPNPTPYLFFGPFDVAIFGEARMLKALEAHPPDHVALVHKDTAEYGARTFGRDYGHGIAAWVRANYQAVEVLGAPPFEDKGFGIALMTRRRSGP